MTQERVQQVAVAERHGVQRQTAEAGGSSDQRTLVDFVVDRERHGESLRRRLLGLRQPGGDAGGIEAAAESHADIVGTEAVAASLNMSNLKFLLATASRPDMR